MAAAFGLIIICIMALLILWAEGVANNAKNMLICAGLIAVCMLLRGLVMNYETLDYQGFLTKWVDYFRDNGGWSALRGSIGNYNLPYLYFLALFSYMDVPDLYLIKLLKSSVCDSETYHAKIEGFIIHASGKTVSHICSVFL